MKKYCQECNAANEYSDKLPKFCQECGHQFASASINISPSKKPIAQKPPTIRVAKATSQEIVPDDDDLDETEAEEVVVRRPKIKITSAELVESLDVPERRQEKLKDVALDTGPKGVIEKRAGKIPSKKKFLEEWQKELSKKPSQEIGGGGVSE